MSTSNKLKAYVRFDGSGRVVPSSLILARFKPKVGNYQEIDAYECCNDVPTTTTTTTQGGETTTTTTTAPSYSYYLGSPCAGGANVIIRSNVTLPFDDVIYHSNNNCCTIFTTTLGPTYDADYVSAATCEACPTIYNAGYTGDGTTPVCDGVGPFSVPLIVVGDPCTGGSITLASGVWTDYGISNGATIYVNLNTGNVIQLQVFGSSQMSFGCTSCG
tara:strand:- start:2231 stop:2881 length:651 start_codon:yes stop_codon:yes gene_type:complete